MIDMEKNEIVFRRMENSKEPIHDLPSGHVGPELVKENEAPPSVKESTMLLSGEGEEVVVDHADFQSKLNVVHSTWNPLFEIAWLFIEGD